MIAIKRAAYFWIYITKLRKNRYYYRNNFVDKGANCAPFHLGAGEPSLACALLSGQQRFCFRDYVVYREAEDFKQLLSRR